MNVSEWIVAEMERREAARQAEWEAEMAQPVPTRGRRRIEGQTVVYSIRLDRDEVRALERRAAFMNLKPTVLARNLIRAGLSTRPNGALSDVVEQLENTMEQLRALVP